MALRHGDCERGGRWEAVFLDWQTGEDEARTVVQEKASV